MLSPDGLTMAPYKVQNQSQDWLEPQKVKDVQSFLGFANYLPLFHLKDIPKSLFHLCALPTGYTLALFWWVAILPLKHLKRLSPQLHSLPMIWTSNYSWDWMPQLCTCCCPFPIMGLQMGELYQLHPLPDFSALELQLWCPQQRATHDFWSFQNDGNITLKALDFHWCGHQSPELQYFQQPKSSCIDKHIGLNIFLVESHYPLPSQKTWTKLTLTRQWDVYLKEGNSDYASINTQNYCLVFTLSNWHHPS